MINWALVRHAAVSMCIIAGSILLAILFWPLIVRFLSSPIGSTVAFTLVTACLIWIAILTASHGRKATERAREFDNLRPYIWLSLYGQATNRPMVSASVASPNGSIGLWAYEDSDANRARVRMDAQTFSHITKLPVVDRI